MMGITHRSTEDRSEIANNQTLVTTSTETTLAIGLKRWSAAWTYCRPTGVSIEGVYASGHMIPDYVMFTRVMIAFVTIVLIMRRN